MFFLTPRHVKQGRQYVKDARKLLAYKRDLVSPEVTAEVTREIAALDAAVKARDREAIHRQAERLDTICGKLTKPQPVGWLRENVEVFLVAIAVALGVRTYFLQPFTIPTGSMQPTLNGIIGTATEVSPPNPVARFFQKVILGRSWFEVIAEDDETIERVEERNGFAVTRRGSGVFTHTAIITDKHEYIVDAAKDAVERTFLARDADPRQGVYKKGDVIVRGHINSGDMVFVDKMTYHFRKPARGEVFVFNTQGVPTRENVRQGLAGPSQFYIKRLAGIPGDSLRIVPPELLINGERARESGFQKVMSGSLERPNRGYQGYSNGSLQPIPREVAERELASRRGRSGETTIIRRGDAYFYLFPLNQLGNPQESITIEPGKYYALGDNSYHSSDSRDWGQVPEQNLMGRGVFVYWPFTSHWGVIR